MTIRNSARANRALLALAVYQATDPNPKDDSVIESAIVDLLTDLRHLCGDAFDLLDAIACGHYLDEHEERRTA